MSTSWADAAMFWVTVVLVLVTMIATAYNYLLFRGTIDPNVIVYPALEEKQPSLIVLVIENIGKGVAKNIQFRLSKPLQQAYGLSDTEAEVGKSVTSGPLVTGIPSLSPGAKRTVLWGQYGGIHRTLGSGVLSITAVYSGDALGPIPQREFVTESLVEVESFNLNALPSEDPLKLIAAELTAIRKLLERRANG